MTKWKTEKQFCSFLGLCPDNSISGGKVLHRATRKVYNRAADIECSAADKTMSNRESTNTNLNSSYSASNGSKEKPNHSTFNSFPLSDFDHQFLESCSGTSPAAP